jgi:uncharacterized Zn-finger protein
MEKSSLTLIHRPYVCDLCGKRFAQHGNIRAHKIVHTGEKPFTCRLDDCGKKFSQLGNLKSHQNKFHVETIRRLKQRFESYTEGDLVAEWEKEMWEYFGGLYKNCNKGIKGRGKDRRISLVRDSSSLSSNSNTSSQQSDSSFLPSSSNTSCHQSDCSVSPTCVSGMANLNTIPRQSLPLPHHIMLA